MERVNLYRYFEMGQKLDLASGFDRDDSRTWTDLRVAMIGLQDLIADPIVSKLPLSNKRAQGLISDSVEWRAITRAGDTFGRHPEAESWSALSPSRGVRENPHYYCVV